MSSKKYFDKATKILKQSDLEAVGKKVESREYIDKYIAQKDRYVPPVDFSSASNFARYGLASKYYEDSVKRIYKQYPYDGSRKEKIEWELSSSYLDKWVFENVYPRTHGWANMGFNWGASKSTIYDYGAPVTASYEYIKIKGGPNSGFDPHGDRTPESLSGSKGIRYDNVNIYDEAKNRTSNLKFNLSGAFSGSDNGVTVEFWLKKNGFAPSNTKREVLFDLWNQKSFGDPNYGRLTIELTASGPAGHAARAAGGNDGCFLVTVQSGTHGVYSAKIGKGTETLTSSVGDNTWSHYALTFNSSSHPGTGYDVGAATSGSVEVKLYVDGELNHHAFTGSSVANVTGGLMAYIGALQHAPSASGHRYNDFGSSMAGYGKLFSASLDEFRYWKVRRTEEEIKRFYNSQVGGGTNTDDANTKLGVYYKFNEGITTHADADSVVLDYSGRVSNGEWVGYNQADTPRQTGSAILEATASTSEFRDPIIYSAHPDVKLTLTKLKASGSIHDRTNTTNIYNSIPTWIREQDELNERDSLANLVQIISSYLDTLHVQIEHLTKIKDAEYASKYKPSPFSNRLLESVGFIAPEIAADASVLEQFLNRNDDLIFEDKLYNLKNFIYQNIYNNLNYIYKSKGTEDSFRNLIRCFGVDEELIKINLYSDNATYQFEDNYKSSVIRKKYIDFNDPDRFGATVFQATASTDLGSKNTRGFISGSLADPSAAGSKEFDFVPFTMECEVLFPKKYDISSTSRNFFVTPFHSSSLFGIHSASAIGEPAESIADYTWSGKKDYANFQVYAIRGTGSRDEADVKFVLTGTAPTYFPSVETKIFKDVYNNEKWNFAVRVRPDKHIDSSGSVGGISNYVEGSKTENEGGYILEFYGVNSTLDKVENEFSLTASLAAAAGRTILNSSKRIYVGAHRTNFTGSVLAKSDVKISSVRYWLDYLPNNAIRHHSFDATSYGVEHPYRNANLFASGLSGTYVPKIDTLALHWTCDQVSSSDAKGQFFVEDASSGTAETHTRYHWYGNATRKRHTGLGFDFPAHSTASVSREYINTAKKQLPEVLNSSDMINILDADVEVFTKSRRPSKYFFAIEKSMYQNVSEDMLKMFSTVKDFNNLIGHPVNKYRKEYKELRSLRRLFFEKVQNTPDIDKFIDFYRWLDSSISEMIGQLAPMSAKFSENVRNVVESHILERNKFDYKFPLLEKKTATEGGVEGRGKRRYPWSLGHHPIGSSQAKNGVYWMERAEVDKHPAISASHALLVTDASGTNFSRAQIQAVKRQILTREDTIQYQKDFLMSSFVDGGINFSFNKKTDYFKGTTRSHGLTDATMPSIVKDILIISGSDIITPRDPQRQLTKDASEHPVPGPLNNIPRKAGLYDRSERKYKFPIQSQKEFNVALSGEQLAPFNLYSSSVDTGYNADIFNNFKAKLEITNLHHDTYGTTKGEPVQGPFTNAHVGGNQHRHIDLNRFSSAKSSTKNLDDSFSRPEAFRILVGNDVLGVVPADYPYNFGGVFNDPRAKKAVLLRDGTAKRPLNIQNIHYTTGSQVLGNYARDYEIVQTSGRSINNRYFVKNLGNSASYAASQYITGVVDYAMPQRTGSGVRSKHIFASRFSAPGGPDTAGGFLDIDSQEYSPYNALPFRNLSVRGPLRELFSRHAALHGSSSLVNGPVGLPSFHKVNRNFRHRIENNTLSHQSVYLTTTGTVADNQFISRPIPQSDLQYSWITASAIAAYIRNDYVYGSPTRTDAEGLSPLPNNIPFGYMTSSGVDGTQGGLLFLTASALGAAYVNAIGGVVFGGATDSLRNVGYKGVTPVDFAGINSIIYEPVAKEGNDPSHAENFLGYSYARATSATAQSNIIDYINTQATTEKSVTTGRFIEYISNETNALWLSAPEHTLNAIIAHRQGPHGWPTFKQIQTGRHPIVRHHRRNNIISILGNPKEKRTEKTGQFKVRRPLRGDRHYKFVEPVFTTKYNKMTHIVSTAGKMAKIDHSYGNKLSTFANKELNERTLYKKEEPQVYDRVTRLYTQAQGGGPIESLVALNYREVLYPKEKHFGLNKARSREKLAEEAGYGNDGVDRRIDQRRTFWPPSALRSVTESATPALNAMGYRVIKRNPWPLGNRFDMTFDVGASGGQPQSIVTKSGSYQGELSPMPLFLGTGSLIKGKPELIVLPQAELQGMHIFLSGTLGRNYVADPHHPSLQGIPYRSASLGFQAVHDDATTPAGIGFVNYYQRPTASLDFVYLPPMQSRFYANTSSHPTEYLYPYNVPEQAGRGPWYDSYEEFSADIRYMAKDHTIVPEFKISDHMEHYVVDKGGDFRTQKKDYLRLDGGTFSSSSISATSSFSSDFFQTYSHSDFLKHFGKIKKDHKKAGIKTSRITLSCEGVKKLLPYNGFYPVTRTVQLASLLSQSIGEHISGGYHPLDRQIFGPGSALDSATPTHALQAFMGYYFSPGLMYNSIKSGIAVDFPMQTASYTEFVSKGGYELLSVSSKDIMGDEAAHYAAAGLDPFDLIVQSQAPKFRLPFESLVDLKNTLPEKSYVTFPIWDKVVTTESGSDKHPSEGPGQVTFLTGIWNGKKSSLYELAMNNFLAEVPKFFLEQRGMRTFISAPEKDFKPMQAGTTYRMDVRLRKSRKFDMIRSYFSSSLWGTDTVPRSYHGRYFGPPTRFRSASLNDIDQKFMKALELSDQAYAPYTPPYFYGDSIARFEFTPGSTRKYTLEEIQASATVRYFNHSSLTRSLGPGLASKEWSETYGIPRDEEIDKSDGYFEEGLFRRFNPVYHPSGSEKGMMQLSSSVKLIGTTRLRKVELDAVTGQPKVVNDPETSDFDAWVISPKWECPALNFYDTAPESPVIGASGIWSTYGNIPTSSLGIFLSMEESNKILEDYNTPAGALSGSLLDVCGFQSGRQRIGEIAKRTKIQEAIVAIPFLERANSKNKMVSIEGKNFFAIDKNVYYKQKENMDSGRAAVQNGELGAVRDISETSISKLIEVMDKYYFPPFMDFSTFLAAKPGKVKKGEEKREVGIDPFVMYVFEFTTELDQDDLADIWQGVMAKPMQKAEKEKSTFSHTLDKWEFFHGKDIPEDVRWLVFKVKQKGEKSYFDITADQKDDARFKFDFKVGEKRPEYNYNWPYDFCSVVELAKIEADIEFSPSGSM